MNDVVQGALIPLSFDHALVDYLEHHYRHTTAWSWIDVVFRPDIVLAVVLLLGLAAWLCQRRGRVVPAWLDDMRAASVAASVALISVFVLKVLFGRSWPDPMYVRQGVDDFRWFAGEWVPQRGAFPSATACVTTAGAAALWRRASTLRIPAVAIAALFGVIVVVQEYHWLSDVIVGVLLGAAIGVSAGSALDMRGPSNAQRPVART